MKILFNLHSYIPEQMSGAETMAHRIAKYLVKAGHDVTVLTKWPDKVVDGVKVKKWHGNGFVPTEEETLWREADLVVTHLGQELDSHNKCRVFQKKLVHLIHNSFQSITIRARHANNYLIYNSEWVKDCLGYSQPSIVVNPPVDYREFAGVKNSGKYLTLINHNENKGGSVLIEIAKRLPSHKFLAVEGGYEAQIKSVEKKNISYVPQESDIRKILKDTRILLVPSRYESWGQVAIEAAACGIPVVTSTARGLMESMAGGGIAVDRDDIEGWVKAITSLDSQEEYAKRSTAARERAIALDPVPQLQAMEEWLHQVSKQPYES